MEGGPAVDEDIFPSACILLRLQFIHVTDMTEPVALALGSPPAVPRRSSADVCAFPSSQVSGGESANVLLF